jgi:tartrate/fumarate subfamily iron-sulfur-dependent hydro-lyase beta chain
MNEYYLDVPVKDEDVEKLRLGDLVYISGQVFTCRSRLQKYIFDEKNELPFQTDDRNVLIHVGPVVIKENDKWRLVSFMPTSSIRFEKWGAKSVSEWGLKMIIGKTTMGKETMKAMKRNKCVHVSPQCVSPNLWLDSIKIQDVYLFDELGTIEAAWHLYLNKLGPFIVDIDARGNNYFDKLNKKISANLEKVYKNLGISKDFEYTILY